MVMAKRAFVYVRKASSFPGLEIKEGLKECGFKVFPKHKQHLEANNILPFDLLVTWTLWKDKARYESANEHQRRGGIVLCSENGWLRNTLSIPYYQFGFRFGQSSGVNGQGVFRDGGTSRWELWNIQLKPWRTSGDYILVRPQRGLKPNDLEISHGPEWADQIVENIRKYSDRPIWWRPHPGNKRPCLPTKYKVDKILDPHNESLQQHLSRAWCMVVYSSSEAPEALINGVPVCYDGQSIICAEGAGRVKDIENPPMVDREALFQKLAWNMWNKEEIRNGQAFRHILQDHL